MTDFLFVASLIAISTLILAALLRFQKPTDNGSEKDQNPVKSMPVEHNLPSQSKLESMTKSNLTQFAKERYGVELDSGKLKKEMIVDLKNAVKSSSNNLN